MASEEQPGKRSRAGPDLTIAVDDGELEVHSIILQLASPVFQGMLNSDMKEGRGARIQLPGKCKSQLEAFYKSLQLCTMEPLTLENVAFLTQWADEYQIEALKGKCEAFLISNAPIDGPGLQFAVKYGLHDRTKQCLNAMKSNVEEHIVDLRVLTTKDCQEYLQEFWPLILSKAGFIAGGMDLPPPEHVASMWPFLVRAVRWQPKVVHLGRILRELPSLPEALYTAMPSGARVDCRARDLAADRLRNVGIDPS
ncbi:bath-38 [Symbiodinium sp. CCMP2592]|nr:bath-38 [Symbiodinium sp. CCMP2592]